MKKILVIEDDSNITAALSIRLKASGYEVLTAPDGLHGLKLARNHWPDLILLDVGLPLLDIRMPLGVGYSVARRLKAMGLGEIPIIFITASKEKGVREAAQEAGAAAFFEKPYDPEELLSAIDQILRSKGGRVPLNPQGTTLFANPRQEIGGPDFLNIHERSAPQEPR